jgi:LysR family glycine cleavage system transcriptional activator
LAWLDAVALCSERLVPVCSPKLLSGHGQIAKASDLLTYPLLRLEGWTTSSKWLEAAGVSASPRVGPALNQASMLIDAAVDGQGVALARTTLAAWDLLHGHLVIPIDISLAPREYLLDRLPQIGVSQADGPRAPRLVTR